MATQPSHIESVGAAITASRSPSVTFTGQPAAGDLIVLFPSSTGTGVTLAIPTGWYNPLGGTTDVESDSHEICCVIHVVTTSEAVSTKTYTATNLFTVAQTGYVHGCIIRGANPGKPECPAASTFNSGNTVTPHVLAGLTPLITNGLVLSSVSGDGTLTYTTPSGWTQRITSNTNQGRWTGTNNTATTDNSAVSATNITPSTGDEYASITLCLAPAPVAISTLTEDFAVDFDRAAKWLGATASPNCYWDSTNKRCGIVTSASFFALKTDPDNPEYSILNSSIYGKFTPPTPGSTTEFHFELQCGTKRITWITFGANLIATTTPGSDLYTVAYSSSTHAWLRIRGDSTTVYWDTSTDGVTWTNRASVAFTTNFTEGTDAWIVNISQGNSTGPADLFIDNINVAPTTALDATSGVGSSATSGALDSGRGFAATSGLGTSATTGALIDALALASTTGLGTSATSGGPLGLARPIASTDGLGTSNATATTLSNTKALASSDGLGTSAATGTTLIQAKALAASGTALGTSAAVGTLIEAEAFTAGSVAGTSDATATTLIRARPLASSTDALGTSATTAGPLGLARPMASTDALGTSNATATTLIKAKPLASSDALGTSAATGTLIEAFALASTSSVGASATSALLGEAKLLAGGSQGQAATAAPLLVARALASSAGLGTSATTGLLGKAVPLAASGTALGAGSTLADLSSGPGLPKDLGLASSSGFSDAHGDLSGGKIKLELLKDSFASGISNDLALGWFNDGCVWDATGKRVDIPGGHQTAPDRGRWLIANGTFDLRNSYCFAQLIIPPVDTSKFRWFTFSIWNHYSPDRYIQFIIFNNVGGGYQLDINSNPDGAGATTLFNDPAYNPIARPWHRFRQTSTNLLLENSADANTWTTLLTVPTTSLFDLSACWPEFFSDDVDDTPTSVHTYVDNVSTKGTDLAATSAIGSSNATGILSRPNSLLASSAVGTSNAVGTLKGAHVPLASAAGAVGVGSTTGFLSVGTEKTETMHDEFPSGVNSSNWTTTGLVDSSGMGWRPGSVRIQMLSTGSALTSLNQFTLHESYVMAQIFPQQIDVNHSFNFGVVGPSGSYIVIKTVGNTIVAEMRTTAGVVWTGTARPYDRIQEAWLRIRETAGLVFFEYSKDAVTWITMENHVATAGPPLSPVNIRIAAASTLPSENTFPRVVIVDNLNVVPTPPPQTETLIDFFNSSIDLTKWTVTNTTWEAGRAKMTGTAAMDSKGSFTLIDSSLVAEFNSAIATSQLAFKLLGQAGPSIGGGFGNEMGFQVGPLTSGKRTVNAYVTVNGVTTFGATVQLGTGGGSVPTNVTLGQAFGGFSMPLEQVQGSVSDATLDTQATTIADIGAGYIRGDYPAYLTEPTQGNFNFTSADRWIVNALSHGLKPVPVCYMLPGWMNGASDDKTPPTNNALYGDWCAAVAQHLWSLGVKHMELWNEQNLSGFWAGQPATDAAYRQKYAAMLADAYPKIKAVAPGMTVISGGVSTADTVFQAGVAPQNRGALSTLQRYGELGLYSHCDAVAWHPYLDSDRPCVDVGGWPAMNLASYQAALAYLDQYAPGRNLQIWTTETGCPRTVSGGATTQQTVGHNLWQMVMGGGCCVTIKDRMGPFFWFTVHDRTTGDSREDGFGFKTANFATKYAIYDTVKTDFAAIYSTTGGGGGTGDPSIDIWLRMREVSGTVVWEYATDPTNFTILWTAPANTAPPLQPLTVEVVST